MAKTSADLKSFKEFSVALLKARKEKHLSQRELARKAHVALRTIQTVEMPTISRKLRFDVVIRLAVALERDPKEWLRLAGRPEISQTEISDVLAKSGVTYFYGQEDPIQLFRWIEERQRTSKQICVCLIYRTFSNFNHQSFLAEHVAPLLDRGNLRLCLVSPYPKIIDIDLVKKQTLSRIYFQVRSEVVAITKEVRSRMKKLEYRNHVAAFSLKSEYENGVPPTTGLSEFRPIIVECRPKSGDDPSYQLSGWISPLRDQRERWMKLYPPPEQFDAHEDLFLKICTAWKEYALEIFHGWETGAAKWKNKNPGVWDMANIPEI